MPGYFLAVDIGNTNITLGLLKDGVVLSRGRVVTRDDFTSEQWIQEFSQHDLLSGSESIDHIAICSVRPGIDESVQKALESCCKAPAIVLSPTGKLPFENAYLRPQNVGMDRLANVAAALNLFSEPMIIIDFGTATTLDVLDNQKRYLGGAILPGIETTADSLFRRTSKLPEIRIERPGQVIGRTTVDAMQSGLFYSSVDSIIGMILRMEMELGYATTILATGGLASLVCSEIERVTAIDNDLTLKGVYEVWKYQSS